MLVLVFALVNCIIGVEVGLRYRILVVVPLSAIVLPEVGLLAIGDEGWSVWRIASLITALQIGYLLGSAMRWLPVRGGALQVRTPQEPMYAIEPHTSPEPVPIDTLKVLVIEDELEVSVLVEQMLRELGCPVVWRCSTAAEAVDFLRERRPDAAVLDINLRGELVYPVAALLDAASIPFVFASGDPTNLPDGWARRPRIQKPFGIESLAAGLTSALDSGVRGTA